MRLKNHLGPLASCDRHSKQIRSEYLPKLIVLFFVNNYSGNACIIWLMLFKSVWLSFRHHVFLSFYKSISLTFVDPLFPFFHSSILAASSSRMLWLWFSPQPPPPPSLHPAAAAAAAAATTQSLPFGPFILRS
jgi:hypothetical protein